MTRRPLIGAIALAFALTGCGVPTSSEVQYVGPGPGAGPELPDEGRAPPSPDAAATAEEQVENFLQAPAGNPDTAAERVAEFIRTADRAQWHPEEIRVVRLLQDPFITQETGGWRVELRVQPVGTLEPSGYLDTLTGGDDSYEFRVVPEGGGPEDVTGESSRLRIADPPQVMLLEDEALTTEDYYHPTPIYFWDDDHEALVPDLRWLPQAGEPADQHPWIVLRWLLGGPSPSLPRLQGLPGGTQPVGTPTWQDGNRLVVNLNAAALGEWDPDDLAIQLDWSLLQLRSNAQLDLRIDDQPQAYTPRERPWAQANPVRLAVLDGVVRQLAGGQPASYPVLRGDVNSGVIAGALADDGRRAGGGRLAALVREDSGRERLSVVRAADGAEPVETPTDLVAGEIGQPTWLGSGEDALGLVVAGGSLYRFTAGGDAAVVPVSGLAGSVTAMAVAPERRRMALVAGDQLYVASLQLDGESVVVLNPRALPTTVDDLAGVAYSHENQLVVAGEEDNRVGLYSLTIDGARQEPLSDLSNATVTSLVAHPVGDSTDFDVMYEANGQAFTFRGAPSLVRAENLIEAPEDAESPPRSPFFAD